jgi:hypothetical protein
MDIEGTLQQVICASGHMGINLWVQQPDDNFIKEAQGRLPIKRLQFPQIVHDSVPEIGAVVGWVVFPRIFQESVASLDGILDTVFFTLGSFRIEVFFKHSVDPISVFVQFEKLLILQQKVEMLFQDVKRPSKFFREGRKLLEVREMPVLLPDDGLGQRVHFFIGYTQIQVRRHAPSDLVVH